jgi:hypothetical protein
VRVSARYVPVLLDDLRKAAMSHQFLWHADIKFDDLRPAAGGA